MANSVKLFSNFIFPKLPKNPKFAKITIYQNLGKIGDKLLKGLKNLWCPGRESNPHGAKPQGILSPLHYFHNHLNFKEFYLAKIGSSTYFLPLFSRFGSEFNYLSSGRLNTWQAIDCLFSVRVKAMGINVQGDNWAGMSKNLA